MFLENVVNLKVDRKQDVAKEYAVLFRINGDQVQFKLFAGNLSKEEKREIAEDFEAAAAAIRRDY
jgi:hypothetical protein